MNGFKFFWVTLYLLIARFLAIFLVPIAVVFADKQGRLPGAFRWLETHDDLGWGAGIYEKEVKWVYDKLGKRCALIWWLWRNRTYSLRSKYRVPADLNEDQFGAEAWSKGRFVARKFGFSYWKGVYKDWWEVQISLGLYWFRFYVRLGWKLTPYYSGDFPKTAATATGIIVPLALRVSSEFGKEPVYWYKNHRE